MKYGFEDAGLREALNKVLHKRQYGFAALVKAKELTPENLAAAGHFDLKEAKSIAQTHGVSLAKLGAFIFDLEVWDSVRSLEQK